MIKFLLFLPVVWGSVEEQLRSGREHLLKGEYNDALTSYDSAIEQDPKSPKCYFMRAAAYLTMGRNTNAIHDFDKVLDLKHDHHAARLQRGKLHLMDGSISLALQDFETCKSHSPNDSALLELLEKASSAQSLLDQAMASLAKNDHEGAVASLSALLSIAPMNAEWRLSRGDAFLSLGDTEMAIGDYSRCVKLKPDNPSLYLKLGKLHLALGELAESLSQIKECLRLDPDQKQCKAEFKRLRKLDKLYNATKSSAEKNRWRDVLKGLFEENLLVTIQESAGGQLNVVTHEWACLAYSKLKKPKEAIEWCSKTLALNEFAIDALVARADAKMELGEYHQAQEDYKRALDMNQQDGRAREGYHKAQKMIKLAGMRDYYKILGVARDASKREIKKAYRKAAQDWHPDKYVGDLSKDDVEKKMSDINAAYEVLSNDELRQMFDNGDDPNDPNANNQQHGHNPFGGGHPFFFQQGHHGGGGHGQQFQFHF